MQIDWIWGLAGGLMIGAAAALYLLAHGRVLGASGIIGGLVDGSGRGNASERLWFLAGLILVPALLSWAFGPVATHASSNVALLVLAGLLVGVGTRLANGCTSGHGVCGMSRLSPRSLAATGIFMAVAAATVFATRHLIGGA
jgi:uncharacterized membrane protein YedE/YeeE